MANESGFELEEESTEDIQNDLAMYLAEEDGDDPYALAMISELKRRNEKLPTNCKYVREVNRRLRVAYDLV